MHCFAIDIETTGLDPRTHGIIEFAAIRFNLFDPGEPVKVFQRWLDPEDYAWSVYCLHMHEAWIKTISDKVRSDPGLLSYEELRKQFDDWLYTHCDVGMKRGRRESVVPAGKNFDGFDRQFLNEHGFQGSFSHRSIDPGSLYTRRGDVKPPDLKLCKQRARESGCARLNGDDVLHNAVDDAVDVVHLLHHAFRE